MKKNCSAICIGIFQSQLAPNTKHIYGTDEQTIPISLYSMVD